MIIEVILQYGATFIKGATSLVTWVSVPLDGIGIAPLELFGISGLVVFLTLAIVKWIIA